MKINYREIFESNRYIKHWSEDGNYCTIEQVPYSVLFDKEGNVLISCDAKCSFISFPQEGVSIVEKLVKTFWVGSYGYGSVDGLYRNGLILTDGSEKFIVEPSAKNSVDFIFGFHNGFSLYSNFKTNLYGYIDMKGNIEIATYKKASNYNENGIAIFSTSNNQLGYRNRLGKEFLFEREYDLEAMCFGYGNINFNKNDLLAVVYKGKWGAIDTKENFVVAPRYKTEKNLIKANSYLFAS